MLPVAFDISVEKNTYIESRSIRISVHNVLRAENLCVARDTQSGANTRNTLLSTGRLGLYVKKMETNLP